MIAAEPNLPKQSDSVTQIENHGEEYNPASTKQQGNEAYSFVSEPVRSAGKKKYRDSFEKEQRSQPVNIMYDRRIHRGNTYASPVLPLHAQPDPVEVQKQNEIRRRLKAKRRAEAQRRVRTPDATEGRKHVDIQTDLYLEELTDKIPEAYAATQTDAFLDRAPSPLYIPQKSGSDVATQVYYGELFDFDFEVEPILEVIVGKTLEQALMEVAEEDELAVLKKHQIKFEEKRNAELAEVQRMEDAERRRVEEKERRLNEQIRLLKEKQDAAEKVAARAFAQAYLSNLVPSVFDSLTSNGYFYDIIEKEVESLFLPWLSGEVDKNMSKLAIAHIIKRAIKSLHIGSLVPPKNSNPQFL
ncbi:Radial spoke head protein 3 [Physocladia obscura]|uniref:Radial spoke head protein 3 n=1 Tax=Physocladia obscura TaxID=109957 RepID=A0AAD5T8I0_9FUNG|nr:Radial spoke head protein 3 [Physocladia obscura]